MATITQWKVEGKLSDTFIFWDHTNPRVWDKCKLTLESVVTEAATDSRIQKLPIEYVTVPTLAVGLAP